MQGKLELSEILELQFSNKVITLMNWSEHVPDIKLEQAPMHDSVDWYQDGHTYCIARIQWLVRSTQNSTYSIKFIVIHGNAELDTIQNEFFQNSWQPMLNSFLKLINLAHYNDKNH